MKSFRGFTLVEAMTTIAVTSVVLATVMATFNNVSRTTTNANKAVALSNSTRNLSDLLAKDFAQAGKGFSDLSILDIKFEFHEDFFEFAEGEVRDQHMYGVADLDYDGLSNASEITLHWFDYDISTHPTFFFQPSDRDEWNTGVYSGGSLYSNNTDAFAGVEEGDIFLIYPVKPFLYKNYDDSETYWNGANEIVDDEEVIFNQAVILQIGEPDDATIIDGDADASTFSMNGMQGITFSDGPIFSKNLSNPSESPTPDFAAMESPFTRDMSRANGYEINSNAWMARKLGNSSSFNRVVYRIVSDDTNNIQVLSRSHNGVQELVATDVTAFVIDLGLSIPAGTDFKAMDRDAIKSFLSGTDAAYWTKGWDSDSSWAAMPESDYKIAIGRHSLQAKVAFTQLGAEDKSMELVDGVNQRKERSFSSQYRLKNINNPVLAE